jgi:PTH1 family peptidyl-tRNA hydrolase
MSLRLAAFLGNPGPEYERNRHNAGRHLAERLPFYASLSWQKKFKGLYARAQGIPGIEEFHLIMPETYMNLSGESVQAAAAFFKIKPEEIIVVHDELELPPGTASFKFGGGLGGHNGLRSLKQSLGTADFWRLRIGIGRPPQTGGTARAPGEGGLPVKGAFEGGPGDVYHWVLSDFTAEDEAILAPVFTCAAAALLRAFSDGPETLLPEWKKKNLTKPTKDTKE